MSQNVEVSYNEKVAARPFLAAANGVTATGATPAEALAVLAERLAVEKQAGLVSASPQTTTKGAP